MCTVNDILVQKIKLRNLKEGSILAFEKTGAYAMTEGMGLFLSHALPRIIFYSKKEGIRWQEIVSRLIYGIWRGDYNEYKRYMLDILNDIDDSIDWKEQKGLVDERILDSFCVITLISDLEDAYGVEIEAAEMIPENFNSVDAIWDMITRLQEKL